MIRVPPLGRSLAFPPTSEALDYPNGLLAVGGDLSPQRLLAAYRLGVFPWFSEGDPPLWWTPDPRSVLLPDELHLSRSLRKTLRSNRFTLSADQAFSEVISGCARGGGTETWISPGMHEAYCELHASGIAHSIEVLNESGELVGGLYGLALGRVFFGESMFSRQTDASKVALAALVHLLKRADFKLIDCQVENPHLNSLGARCISRLDFESRLAHTVDEPACAADIWTLSAHCGELL